MSKSHPVQSNTLAQHADMLNDRARNEWFQHRIEQVCPNKTVLDVGAGTGLLTYYALHAGARHVYVVETDPGIIPTLRGVLSKCFSSDRYTIIEENFWCEEVEQHIPKNGIDVVVSETLGGAGIDEGILSTWWCAQQFCRPDSVFIPDYVSIDLLHWDTKDFLGDVPQGAELIRENNLPDQFLEALLLTDSEDIRLYEWKIVNDLKPGPMLHELSWQPDKLPEYRFDLPFPMHVCPVIDFTIELPKGLLGFLPSMNGERLHKFKHKHWRQAPFYYIPATGTYRITYKDLGKDDTNLQWVIQRVL